MAAVELSSSLRESFPYQAVGMIEVQFPNGDWYTGTFAVVGRNDILTATHVVYDADSGGWAKQIRLWAGVDYNSVTGAFEDVWLQDPGNYGWNAIGWPQQIGPDNFISDAEAQFDVALIGLSWPIGDSTGWFGLHAGHNNALTAVAVGYPSGGTGMMRDFEQVRTGASSEIYVGDGPSMGPGSSGGPLFTTDNYIIGVKSAGNAYGETWADIGHLLPRITEAMVDNDRLLPDFAQKGTSQAAEVFVFRSEKTGGGKPSFSYFYTSSAAEAENIRSHADWPWVQKTSTFEAAHSNLNQSVPLYRFWSETHQSHFFTSDETERAQVANWSATGHNGYDWRFEGEAFRVYRTESPVDVAGYDAVAVYRIWMQDKDRNAANGQAGGHYYTADVDEYNSLVKLVGNVGEGIAFYGEELG